MNTEEKTIYLARHAKSSWNSGAARDFDRPLSARGLADAKRMAEALHQRKWRPQRVLSSPAMRARQTAAAYVNALGLSPDDIVWNDDIYMAYTITLLHLLTRLPEKTTSIMLVGHNPSMEELLVHLCGETACAPWVQENGKLLTTGNVARLRINGPWKEIMMNEAVLEDLLRPKQLA